MNNIKALSDLDIGQQAIIKEINLSGNIKKRLNILGFMPNSKVTCRIIAPSGSPIAYFIKGSLIAIRKKDAEKIMCEVIVNE